MVFFPRKMFRTRTHIELLQAFQMYREIQVLCTCYNNIHRYLLIPVYILMGVNCFCFSTDILVSRFHQLDFTAVTAFSNALLLGTIIMLLCFHYPVQVLTTSRITLRKCQLEVGRILKSAEVTRLIRMVDGSASLEEAVLNRRRLLLKKCCKALPPVKISFFRSNYFDRMTPLVLFKFCIRMAIKLTLIEQ